jgi:hypothetical protein
VYKSYINHGDNSLGCERKDGRIRREVTKATKDAARRKAQIHKINALSKSEFAEARASMAQQGTGLDAQFHVQVSVLLQSDYFIARLAVQR